MMSAAGISFVRRLNPFRPLGGLKDYTPGVTISHLELEPYLVIGF